LLGRSFHGNPFCLFFDLPYLGSFTILQSFNFIFPLFLGRMKQRNHQKCENGRRCVYNQLPGFSESHDKAAKKPDHHNSNRKYEPERGTNYIINRIGYGLEFLVELALLFNWMHWLFHLHNVIFLNGLVSNKNKKYRIYVI